MATRARATPTGARPVGNANFLVDLGRDKPAGQVLVGFAAETDDLVAHATEKLRAKRLDLIVGNDISQPDAGFEVGLELVAKARRYRQPVAELPTIWLDRTFGVSNFKLAKWLPKYLRWYFYAFGPKITASQTQESAS